MSSEKYLNVAICVVIYIKFVFTFVKKKIENQYNKKLLFYIYQFFNADRTVY